MLLLDRIRDNGPSLLETYINAHSKDGACFVSRDAAKTIFPEFLQSPTRNNRYTDAAASALADAARRTLLRRPVQSGKELVMISTGAPASGKTRSALSKSLSSIEIQHETIFTSLSRSMELVEQALAAGRFPIVHLFYTDDPRINVCRMISRARTIGRTVPLSYMAKAYLGVPSIVSALEAKYGQILRIRVTNNSEAEAFAVDHNRTERALYHVNRYTEKAVLEAMQGNRISKHLQEFE